MNKEQIIYSENFTDSDGNLHYFNTGRDNISGTNFPNHYIKNEDNYAFIRILNIILSRDTSLTYPIHECFLLTTYKNNDLRGITNIINIDAIVKNGSVNSNDINITCTPLNYNGTLDCDIHSVKVALKSVLNNDTGTVSLHLGFWLESSDIVDIIIKDLSSLAYNEIPNNIYNQFLQCDYESYYLNNEDVVYEVNMFNYQDSIGNIIANTTNVNQLLIDKVKNINDRITVATPDYQFMSIIYDDMYSINSINVDEIIKPTGFRYVQVNNSFVNIVNNYIQVKQKGNYIIALKVDMDIHEGSPSEMMISLFLNDDRIQETTCSLYLDPTNKVYPSGFLAGQFQVLLKPSDKLYMKVRWTNKDNVFIENHCSVQITKLNIVE